LQIQFHTFTAGAGRDALMASRAGQHAVRGDRFDFVVVTGNSLPHLLRLTIFPEEFRADLGVEPSTS